MDVEIVAETNIRGNLIRFHRKSLTVRVVGIQFLDTPEGLRQNQRLQVRILLEHLENRLVVQRGPFLDSNQGRIAYVVQEGVALRREIEVGARSARLIEIVSGLDEGERIIVSSTDSFRNAQQVLIN